MLLISLFWPIRERAQIHIYIVLKSQNLGLGWTLTTCIHAQRFTHHPREELVFLMVNPQTANQNTHGQSKETTKRNQPNPTVYYSIFLSISHRFFWASEFSDSRWNKGMRSCAICLRRTLDGVDVIATNLIGRQAGLLNALLLFVFVFAISATPRTRVTIPGNCSVVTVV